MDEREPFSVYRRAGRLVRYFRAGSLSPGVLRRDTRLKLNLNLAVIRVKRDARRTLPSSSYLLWKWVKPRERGDESSLTPSFLFLLTGVRSPDGPPTAAINPFAISTRICNATR